MLKIQHFLDLYTASERERGRPEALRYARNVLKPLEKGNLKFLFIDRDFEVSEMEVKKLMLLFALKVVEGSVFQNLVGRYQKELVSDLINIAILCKFDVFEVVLGGLVGGFVSFEGLVGLDWVEI